MCDELRRSQRLVTVLILIFLATPLFIYAQEMSISGVVKDEEGIALPGVTVTAIGPMTKTETTDADGRFVFSGLSTGLYDVRAELSGFVTIEKLEIDAASGESLAFTMRPSSLTELMVVTASKVETALIDAPATMSVVTSQTLEAAPVQNYGDVLRNVPGVNVIQTSARDINITSRGATSTLANQQLALLDGRTIYQDFFGLILWDVLPVNFNEIKQIEVIRGPASAVWGANALTGVVNILTKSPREMVGTSFLFSAGVFDRETEANPDADSGSLFGVSVSHAQAINDSWSYKVSAGYFDSDEYTRPIGLIPRSNIPGHPELPTGGFPYPPFENTPTSQPKFDIRFDQELNNGGRLVYAGGFGSTEGIIHSGIGPFDIDSGTGLSYGKVNYSSGNFKLNFFVNILDGDATNLLNRGPDGRPIPFSFETQTYDIEVGNSNILWDNHIITYGGNFRRNNFDLSLAPRDSDRNEVGGYIQDEILFDKFRFVIGGRVDKFDVIDDPVFSPRLTAMFKPKPEHAIRVSYNRAFRSPTLINNFLETTILNPLDLGLIDPRLAGQVFVFPSAAVGNEDLKEESLTAYEIGYTGEFNRRTTINVAYYVNDQKENINFTVPPGGVYTAANPPPGWPLPPQVLTLLAQNGVFLPTTFTYLNLGPTRQDGIELAVNHVVNKWVTAQANYSWQDDPEIRDNEDGPDFPASELIFPPTHRFNASVNFNYRRYLGDVSVNYSDDAFWTDVLDSRFHGASESYTLFNVGFGVRWLNDHLTTAIKINNLLNEEVQQHIFGDIIKRSITGEVKIDL